MPTMEATPQSLDDGTIDAVVLQPPPPLETTRLMALAIPPVGPDAPVAGRYWLARCGAATPLERAEFWSFVLRRPLFLTTVHTVWEERNEQSITRCEVLLPPALDAAYRWLAERPTGATVNLIGPLGQGFKLQPNARNLLLVTDLARLPICLSLIDQMLDRNGRVTLLLRSETNDADAIRNRLPLAVELRLATNETQWQQHLGETIRWADQVAAALPNALYPALATHLRSNRTRLEHGFAQVLVEADLACGVGACLACTIPVADGSQTRACVHGPVFDLAALAGK
jgi:dihydroorotate dehydrogenase electron transfer subunit